MGQNTQGVAYNFGQMGSGLLKTAATTLYAPRGKVIVAITMLEPAKFSALVGDASEATGTASLDQGPADTAFMGTQTKIAANGGDGEAGGYNQALSDELTNAVEFPKGITIFGRWTNVSLQANLDNGVICYYGQ